MEQIAKDVLVAALEGGSNYWIEKFKFRTGDDPKDEVLEYPDALEEWGEGKAEIVVSELNSGNHFVLNIDAYLKGVRMYCDEQDITSVELWNMHDANDADIVLQLACFGELIYG